MANPNIVSVATIYGGNMGWALSNTLTATLLTVDAGKLLKLIELFVLMLMVQMQQI